ncbi:MAG TPA: hypothetical protein VFA86_03585 [Gammaproteobacteria bacterium]|nr:hypothetical protein [Gammaproteobacteria bacterium]
MSVRRNFQFDGMPTSYELIELGGLERGTDESAAVKATLGEPVQGALIDRSTLPLIIVGYDPRRLTEVLLEQRTEPETSLRPIAVAGIQSASDAPAVDQLADLVIAPHAPANQLNAAREALLELSLKLRELPVGEDDGALRLLQYLDTRGRPLQPVLDPASRMAYRYPVAERMLDTSVAHVLELLTDMSRYGLLSRGVVDRLYVCPDCNSYRIPVKELCPECHGPDVAMEVSIHHFRCGYVAPESAFRRTERPICPKCHDPLRHVGVEYNRPGQFVVCGGCGYWATEPELRAWCVDCNRLYAPENLRVVRVHRFAPTASARRVARAGTWHPGRERLSPRDARRGPATAGDEPIDVEAVDEDGGPPTQNREMLRKLIEMARPPEWPMTLYLARVRVPGTASDDRHLWIRKAEQALSRALGRRDMMTRVGPDSFLLVMPESEQKKAPSARDIERWMRKRLGVALEIGRIEADRALQLLDRAG